MKYEFHIGEYVETKCGAIGYISYISNDKELWWLCTNKSDGYEVGVEYSIIGIEKGNYNRIGNYDFTKPENSKEIERLNNCNWNSTAAKINELVDAVNELRKKVNYHLPKGNGFLFK